MAAPDLERIAATLELQQFVADYWHELDANCAQRITEFYVDDCTFVAGANYSYSGHAGVRKFYDDRAELVRDEIDGVRTTRHTAVNLRIAFRSPGTARLEFVLVNYSGAGCTPVQGFEGPTMVCDVILDCRRDNDGGWRIVNFRGIPLFVGSEPFSRKVLAKT